MQTLLWNMEEKSIVVILLISLEMFKLPLPLWCLPEWETFLVIVDALFNRERLKFDK